MKKTNSGKRKFRKFERELLRNVFNKRARVNHTQPKKIDKADEPSILLNMLQKGFKHEIYPCFYLRHCDMAVICFSAACTGFEQCC